MSEITVETIRADRAKWCEALRSDRFEQAYGRLRDSGNGRCCLGVACEVLGAIWTRDGIAIYGDDSDDAYLPVPLAERLGLSKVEQESLTIRNDGGGEHLPHTLRKIADYIEILPIREPSDD